MKLQQPALCKVLKPAVIPSDEDSTHAVFRVCFLYFDV